MRAFIRFNKGILLMPPPVQLWVALLVGANVVVPLFFWDRLEARLVLLSIVASMALMTQLTARFGFTRIVGLGHILWIPLLVFLVLRLDTVSTADFYGTWLRIVIVLNSVSLLLDTVDVIRYLAGERDEIVAGL